MGNRKAKGSETAERQTNSGRILALLQREEGATLAEMIDATGWQPHSGRAALTGLRKKGHRIERTKRGETSCWRIVERS
ncbi:MAG: DUF3489 domain-containing protein [Sphingomicrobium sp.]